MKKFPVNIRTEVLTAKISRHFLHWGPAESECGNLRHQVVFYYIKNNNQTNKELINKFTQFLVYIEKITIAYKVRPSLVYIIT